MVSITESRTIDASPDHVWKIVSDVDKDPDYWTGLSSIHNIRKDGNVIEREVVVGFMGRKSTQKITLRPKEEIRLDLVNGPLLGSRLIKLVQVGSTGTRVEIAWDIEFSQIPTFALGFVKSRLEETTREALERIAKAAKAPTLE